VLRSVLRYPGGKSRAIPQIIQVLPQSIQEFREPMVGGGALYLYMKQSFKSINKFWINDINLDLTLFWLYAQTSNSGLIEQIQTYLEKFASGKELFNFFRNSDIHFSELEKAARFFILNRITFSGTTEAGGFSEEAWQKRMTISSLDRLRQLEQIMHNTQVTCSDYNESLVVSGNEVFVFLDPPYYSAKKSKLYGKNGCNHTSFDFELLADNLKKCKHNWLMTLDDNSYIRGIFGFANIRKWSLQYGMNNVIKHSSSRGHELFISNYEYQDYTIFNFAN
jgi:DNA adenine methylase